MVTRAITTVVARGRVVDRVRWMGVVVGGSRARSGGGPCAVDGCGGHPSAQPWPLEVEAAEVSTTARSDMTTHRHRTRLSGGVVEWDRSRAAEWTVGAAAHGGPATAPLGNWQSLNTCTQWVGDGWMGVVHSLGPVRGGTRTRCGGGSCAVDMCGVAVWLCWVVVDMCLLAV